MKTKTLSYVLMFVSMMAIVTALTVLSIDNVDIQSNSQYISGKQWVLDVVLDQLNDKITGVIYADQMVKDGQMAKNDLYFDAEVIKKACTYNILNQQKPIFTYSQKFMEGWPFNDEDECYNQGGAYYVKEWDEFNGRCVFIDLEGYHGTLDFDTYQFESRLELKVDGQTEIGIIDNMDNPDTIIGTQAYANWVGNLVSGDLCEDARDQDVVAVLTSSGNRLTDETDWDKYNIYQTSGFESCLDRAICDSYFGGLCVGGGQVTTQDCVDELNEYSSSALATKTFRSSDGSVASVSGTTARIDLKKAIQFPELRLRVKADWLGIYIPVGEPEIISVSVDDFIEGNRATLQVNYRNKGDYEGSFSLSVECEDDIDVSGSVPTLTLEAGKTGSRSFTLEAKRDITSEVSDKCDVVFKERNSGDVATKTVTVKVTPQTFCTSGEDKCIGEQAYACSSTGQWVRDEGNDEACVVTCSVEADCDDGNPDTIDTCEASGINGKVCKHELDPDVARLQCEAEGGKFVKKEEKPPVWQFWRDSETTYVCLKPHVSALGIFFIIGGILGVVGTMVFLGGMPPALIASILMVIAGIILTTLAGIGMI